MHPAKVVREHVRQLTDLPNVGPATAGDLRLLGIAQPAQLIGADPLALYRRLCEATGVRQDPCVLDVLISVVHFMDGGAPEPWWRFTEQRKRRYGTLPAYGEAAPVPMRGAERAPRGGTA